MKNKILYVILMCVLIAGVLTGCNACSPIKLKDNPAVDAPVTSNGGLVVQKGNYLYFANGYEDVDSLQNGDNEYNKVEYSAIYRAKLTNNELMYDITTNEDEEEVKTLKNVELLIPKVIGCDSGSFFMFDDRIYYASPTTKKDSSGSSRFDLITFFSCKLDGSKTKELYSVDAYGDEAKYNMIKADGKVYIEIYDGTNIIILTIEKNKVKKEVVVSEGATISSVKFASVDPYNPQNNTTNKNDMYVYYTRDLLDSEIETKGNVLCKASVKDGKEEILIKDNKSTIKVVDYENNNIFYTADNGTSAKYIVYYSNVESINPTAISYLDTENVYVISSSNLVGVVCNYNDQLVRVLSDNSTQTLYTEKLTVITVKGNYIFGYNSSNELVVVNVDGTGSKILTGTNEELEFDKEFKLDVCGNYVYYLNEYKGDEETGYYLNRIEITSEDSESELVGKVDPVYIETEKEDEE